MCVKVGGCIRADSHFAFRAHICYFKCRHSAIEVGNSSTFQRAARSPRVICREKAFSVQVLGAKCESGLRGTGFYPGCGGSAFKLPNRQSVATIDLRCIGLQQMCIDLCPQSIEAVY